MAGTLIAVIILLGLFFAFLIFFSCNIQIGLSRDARIDLLRVRLNISERRLRRVEERHANLEEQLQELSLAQVDELQAREETLQQRVRDHHIIVVDERRQVQRLRNELRQMGGRTRIEIFPNAARVELQCDNSTPTLEPTRRERIKHQLTLCTQEGDAVGPIQITGTLNNGATSSISQQQQQGSLGHSLRSWYRSMQKIECAICLEAYQAGVTIACAKTDGCTHIFHKDCLIEWLQDHDECPLCRTDIINADVENQESET